MVAGVEGADDSVMVDVSWAMWWVPWQASAKYQEIKRSYFRSVAGEIQLHHQNASHNRHDTDDAEALNLPPSNQRSQKRRYKKCAKIRKAVLNWQARRRIPIHRPIRNNEARRQVITPAHKTDGQPRIRDAPMRGVAVECQNQREFNHRVFAVELAERQPSTLARLAMPSAVRELLNERAEHSSLANTAVTFPCLQ